MHWDDAQSEPARSFYSRALAIYESRLGPDVVAVAEVSSRLGGLAYSDWQLDRAEALYARAHGLYDGVLGAADPATVAADQYLQRVRAMRRAYGAALAAGR